jgi:hypothetical protein
MAFISKIATLLPQSEHCKKANQLAQEIHSLQQSLRDKTGQVFQKNVSNIQKAIQDEKQNYVHDLNQMNGSYYQDPNSILKRAWDKMVELVQLALGFKVERADQLDGVFAQLNNDSNDANINAKRSIDDFKRLEKNRDTLQNQLNQILSFEKTASDPKATQENLETKRNLLKQKHKELCGNYFGDPNGTLHQAWEEYQTALAHGSTHELSLAAYQELDTYRKQIEAELYDIERQLGIPASATHTYEVLTTQSITKQIAKLQEIQRTVPNLSKYNWSNVAAKAAKDTIFEASLSRS